MNAIHAISLRGAIFRISDFRTISTVPGLAVAARDPKDTHMSRTEPEYQDFEGAAEQREPGIPSELWSLLRTISTQINEADQRHTGLLQELRDRLAVLSREAEDVRGTMPADAAPAYERIESGLADLAQRIDALDELSLTPAQDGPAVLRSAAGSDAMPARGTIPGGIDPFDVVGDEDGDGSVWDRNDAEALTRIYEDSDAALVRTSPRSLQPDLALPQAELPDMPVASRPADRLADPLPVFSAAPPAADASISGVDRNWLDQRLSDIALRLEQSLADFRGDFSADNLGHRFDAFEQRMGSVLGDVATRTDMDGLRVLEGQIQDLAAHLEHTEQQLGRLDGIEQQLQAVIDHLSSDFGPHVSADTTEGMLPDLKSLAHSTAEEVAQRFAAGMNAAGDPRIDELGSLLRSMIHDRRNSDEQTFTMLDTVQQAMIRMLDRMDALEAGPAPLAAGIPDGVETNHDFAEPGYSEQQPQMMARVPHAARADIAPAMPYLAPTVTVQPVDAGAQDGQLAAPIAAASTVDKLRQDFIADAQRAKLRAQAAAADGAAAAASSAPPAARPAGGLPRPGSVSSKLPDVAIAGSSRRQRLTALALCLVIAVSGAALFAKRQSAPSPVAPAGVTEIAPSTSAPAASVPAAEVPGEGFEIDVPAAAGADNAAPVTGEGAGFEVPAEADVEVPAPVPDASLQPDSDASGGIGSEAPDVERGPQVEGRAPHGIILQDSGRKPSAQELVHLQSQQNNATLSTRLGSTASRLTPADLMPEEVARHTVARIAATADDLDAVAAVPASLSVAAMPGETIQVPVTNLSKSYSQLSLPPATVGPLSLRLAAANGDPSAAFEVGARLAEGKGTPQNFHEAIIWYQKSASQGFAQSQYRLGTLYERGLGVKADVARAQMWYQRAAEQGHVKAMHNLAVLSAGRTSGAPDYVSAARWFEGASEYGLADSQYNLAVLHENGLGVPKDVKKAFKWYALAGHGGDKEALRRQDALKTQLSADERLALESEIALYQPKRSEPLINDARVAGEDWKKRQDGRSS